MLSVMEMSTYDTSNLGLELQPAFCDTAIIIVVKCGSHQRLSNAGVLSALLHGDGYHDTRGWPHININIIRYDITPRLALGTKSSQCASTLFLLGYAHSLVLLLVESGNG